MTSVKIKQPANQTIANGKVRQKNVEIILRAAEQEFVSYGFKGASIKRIAERAQLPRANIHYYFASKTELYGTILEDILQHWNATFDHLSPEDDPATVLAAYIREKVMYSKTNPLASRIFASEIIHGAPHLSHYLKTGFRTWIQQKTRIIQHWIDQGKLDPVEPAYLLFLIWGATQHYADFGVQICAALGKKKLNNQDYHHIADTLITIVLKGCGLSAPGAGSSAKKPKEG